MPRCENEREIGRSVIACRFENRSEIPVVYVERIHEISGVEVLAIFCLWPYR